MVSLLSSNVGERAYIIDWHTANVVLKAEGTKFASFSYRLSVVKHSRNGSHVREFNCQLPPLMIH